MQRVPQEAGGGLAEMDGDAVVLWESCPSPASDLLHRLLLQGLWLPDEHELWLLAHLLEAVGPQWQGLGAHTPGSQALGSGCCLLTSSL